MALVKLGSQAFWVRPKILATLHPFPQEIVSVVVMRRSDWQIFVILFTKLYCLFFASLGNKNTMYS